MKDSGFFDWIAILAAVGMLVSVVSLKGHYSSEASSFCNINETLNCDIVNRSRYSEIAGVPVAALGLAGYAGMLFLSLLQRKRADTAPLLMFLSGAGLVFSLYLTYVEGFVLETWCILCLTSLAAIVIIFGLSTMRVRNDLRQAKS